jgi:hypothetical protein
MERRNGTNRQSEETEWRDKVKRQWEATGRRDREKRKREETENRQIQETNVVAEYKNERIDRIERQKGQTGPQRQRSDQKWEKRVKRHREVWGRMRYKKRKKCRKKRQKKSACISSKSIKWEVAFKRRFPTTYNYPNNYYYLSLVTKVSNMME